MSKSVRTMGDLIKIAGTARAGGLSRKRTACLHTEVFKNLGVDESELPNHTAYYARKLLEIARMLVAGKGDAGSADDLTDLIAMTIMQAKKGEKMGKNVRIAKELVRIAREITAASRVSGVEATEVNGSIIVKVSGDGLDNLGDGMNLSSYVYFIKFWLEMFEKVDAFVKGSCPHLAPRYNDPVLRKSERNFEQVYDAKPAGGIDDETIRNEMDSLLDFING